ncbi:MAG: type II CRISPR-associated endonuclease Cas1 [Pleomorphochaeta sp.]
MSFRAVLITKQSKLEYRQKYLVIRTKEKTKRIYIDEISLLMIEHTAVCITAVLLQELCNKNIDVIFCDNKRNPCSNLVPFYGSYDSSEKVNIQINWDDKIKALVWTELVKEKVKKQGELLDLLKINSEKYFKTKINEIEINDPLNIEAQAAKKYFHFLFSNKFTRSSDTAINSALNYGYMIMLSLVNREITAKGYLTQLGLHHHSIRNQFNLSCDIIEPLRPIVDKEVLSIGIEDEFGSEEKHLLLNIFEKNFIINNKKYSLQDTVNIYCSSIFSALEHNNLSEIKFYNFEYGKD